MRMYRLSLAGMVLWTCCLTAVAQQQELTPMEAAAFREKVSANIKAMQSLESDFTLAKRLSYVENEVKSTGKLYFKAPGKIRWEYLTPKPTVEVYDLAAKRPKGTAGLLANIITGGEIFDEKQFNIDYYRARDAYSARLTPKEKALGKYVKAVDLAFSSGTLLLERIKITEPSADYTLIHFKNQRKNTAIPENKFTK